MYNGLENIELSRYEIRQAKIDAMMILQRARREVLASILADVGVKNAAIGWYFYHFLSDAVDHTTDAN